MPYGFTLWAAGNGPNPLIQGLVENIGEQKALQTNARGRLVIDNWLRVKGMPRVYGIGLFSSPSPPPSFFTLIHHSLHTRMVVIYTIQEIAHLSTTARFLRLHRWPLSKGAISDGSSARGTTSTTPPTLLSDSCRVPISVPVPVPVPVLSGAAQ